MYQHHLSLHAYTKTPARSRLRSDAHIQPLGVDDILLERGSHITILLGSHGVVCRRHGRGRGAIMREAGDDRGARRRLCARRRRGGDG